MPVKRVVLAEYFTTEDLTLLFIVRADFEEPEVVEIKTPLDEVRQFVTANFSVANGGSKVRDLDLDEWQTCFGPFVQPILPWTDEGDIVWLVPHDVLHYLPLHALKVEGRHLIERNPVCYTPSASVMKYCHAKRKGRREKALVLGDSRDDLMHAREEALTVADLFNTTPYLNGQATKSLVKEKLEKEREELDILHFSCHGYFDPYQALKSGIMLAVEQNGDGAEGDDEKKWNLTAEEIFGLEMRADLVTLSACETGVNERRPGDELIGLTRALIYAGTPSVVVSLWAVDDLSTGLLMQHFYQALQKPSQEHNGQSVTKAQALQAAQLFVKDLTAQQVIAYCDRRLAELTDSQDAERMLRFQLDRANAQAAAGDLKPAIATYRDVQDRLSTPASEQGKRLAAQVAQTLPLLEFKAEATPAVNYDARPFEHFYHWAPFILVGDWK
jgi:CHAT domain-containing protein